MRGDPERYKDWIISRDWGAFVTEWARFSALMGGGEVTGQQQRADFKQMQKQQAVWAQTQWFYCYRENEQSCLPPQSATLCCSVHIYLKLDRLSVIHLNFNYNEKNVPVTSSFFVNLPSKRWKLHSISKLSSLRVCYFAIIKNCMDASFDWIGNFKFHVFMPWIWIMYLTSMLRSNVNCLE